MWYLGRIGCDKDESSSSLTSVFRIKGVMNLPSFAYCYKIEILAKSTRELKIFEKLWEDVISG